MHQLGPPVLQCTTLKNWEWSGDEPTITILTPYPPLTLTELVGFQVGFGLMCALLLMIVLVSIIIGLARCYYLRRKKFRSSSYSSKHFVICVVC